MKYKIGDKVRVRENLPLYIKAHCVSAFSPEILKYNGMIVTVSEVKKDQYKIEEDKGFYDWYEDMLEPVEEMSAEEALKTYAEICSTYHFCDGCPIGDGDVKDPKECNTILSECTEDTLLRLKQWKADHEKKPIQTENAWFILIMDTNRKIVHEEKLDVPCDGTFNLDYEQRVALKRYCNEHDGKFIAVREFRSVVKE